MTKFPLIPRTKSGWLSLVLLALLIPAYWDEFQAWRIRRGAGGPAAPVPAPAPEAAPVRITGGKADPHLVLISPQL